MSLGSANLPDSKAHKNKKLKRSTKHKATTTFTIEEKESRNNAAARGEKSDNGAITQQHSAKATKNVELAPASSKKNKRKAALSDNADREVQSEKRPSKKVKTVIEQSIETPKPKKKSNTTIDGETATIGYASPPIINKAPTEAHTILVFGTGECGELGLGPKKKLSLTPRLNPFLNPKDADKFHVVQVACGGMHTLALTRDNKIISWGVNDNGALGRDTQWDGGLRDADDSEDDEEENLNPYESTPVEIPAEMFSDDVKFVQVAAGDSCSLALTDTGAVYGWGTFLDSQGRARFRLDGTTLIEKQEKPVLIPHLKNIVQIACGANHALAVDSEGAVWGWGSNEQNQLGHPFSRVHEDSLRPSRLKICRRKVKYVASGEYHAFAVDVRDRVWGWGLNSFGEAGDPKTAGGNAAVLEKPVKIRALSKRGVAVLAGGAHHSAAVTADGQCLVWGRLDGGQLGIKFSAEQLADETCVRFDEYNKPRICLRPTAVPSEAVGRVVHVACGTDHTLFVNGDGKGFATGFGTSGQLGLGNENDADVLSPMGGKKMEGRVLIWAGAGGQYSVVAAAAAAVEE